MIHIRFGGCGAAAAEAPIIERLAIIDPVDRIALRSPGVNE